MWHCGRFERAVELLALVVEHPASHLARLRGVRIRDSAQSLLVNLEADLPHEVYAAAFKRGRGLELDEVVADLIGARGQGDGGS